MRGLLTTQNQNCYREQVRKEMLTRLAWNSRYANLYPTCDSPGNTSTEPAPLPAKPRRAVKFLVTRTPERQGDLPPPPPPPPVPPVDEEQRPGAPPLMRPVSPQTRQSLYQDSSQHGKGRSLYLQRRGRIRPEERFDFPLLSSWEYGWRLGDHTLDYRTPSCARSSVVKNTFYAKNGVFH